MDRREATVSRHGDWRTEYRSLIDKVGLRDPYCELGVVLGRVHLKTRSDVIRTEVRYGVTVLLIVDKMEGVCFECCVSRDKRRTCYIALHICIIVRSAELPSSSERRWLGRSCGPPLC